jgi:hypothetical protein
MMLKKILLYSLLLCGAFPFISFSQEVGDSQEVVEEEEINCEVFVPEIVGSDLLVKDSSMEFKASTREENIVSTHTFALYS